MSELRIEPISEKPFCLGEGPFWVPSRRSLLFTDIHSADVHEIFIETGRHRVLHIDSAKSVSFVVPVAGKEDTFIIGHDRHFAKIVWPLDSPDISSKKADIITPVDEDARDNRLNDGKCDPSGRVWAGTMGPEPTPGKIDLHKGSLFRMDKDGSITKHASEVSVSNGMAWSHDKKTFFYIDSFRYAVDAFDYDDKSGRISNRRMILDYKAQGLEKDLPDGMTIDTDGNLWVASFSGHKIIKIDPAEKKIVQTIQLPCPNVTSVCFGGLDYKTLYATTAWLGMSEEDKQAYPLSGCVFAITGTGARGMPGEEVVLKE